MISGSFSQLLILSVAAVIVTLPSAEAGRKVATGKIDFIDTVNRTISLSSGDTYRAGPKVKLSTRKVGEIIIVVYDVTEDGLLAVKVRRAPQSLEKFSPILERSTDAKSSQTQP